MENIKKFIDKAVEIFLNDCRNDDFNIISGILSEKQIREIVAEGTYRYWDRFKKFPEDNDDFWKSAECDLWYGHIKRAIQIKSDAEVAIQYGSVEEMLYDD